MVGIERWRTTKRFAEFRAGRIGNERKYDPMSPKGTILCGPVDSAYEVNSTEDIPPLIATTGLKCAILAFVKDKIVECLKELVREFRVRDSVFPFHPAVYGLSFDHVVYCEVLANVTEEVEKKS